MVTHYLKLLIATGHCHSRYLYQVCALDLGARKSIYNIHFYGLRSNFPTGTVYLPRHAATATNSVLDTKSYHDIQTENDSHRTKSNTAVSAGRS
jgi:hypothetical protein